MRILFIDSAADCSPAKAGLAAAGHEVALAEPSNAKAVETALARTWDVIVFDASTGDLVLDALQGIIAKSDDPPAHIVCSAKPTPATIEAAFKSGAEDFLRKPIVVEQLRGRIERMTYHRQCVAAAATRGEAESRSATSKITTLRAWGGFHFLAAEAVSGVTMLDLAVTKAPVAASPAMASTMLLSVASEQVECRVAVDGDQQSLELLADAAVGAHDRASIADLLGEIANNAGGVFMRAAFEEEIVLTTGLPVEIALSEVERQLSAADHSVVCWVADPASGAQLRVRLAVRARRNAFVRVSALREGMVLVSDLKSAEGGVLLTAGTRVTSSTSERVRRMLDARPIVEVADAAA